MGHVRVQMVKGDGAIVRVSKDVRIQRVKGDGAILSVKRVKGDM